MEKLIAVMNRKSGISREEFREYYENNHAPLAVRHFGKYFSDYRRNYPTQEFVYVQTDAVTGNLDVRSDEFSYDVISEFWFHDRTAMEEMFKALTQVQESMTSDEEKFIDRSSIRSFVVSEQKSELPARK